MRIYKQKAFYKQSSTFKKLYKRKVKKSPDFIVNKVKEALRQLKENPIPESLGNLKKGELRGIRAIELGNKNRLSYEVIRNDGQVIVNLHKVCTHDQVYGK